MVGQNIGKYRVHDRVGRGGMGTVYRAIDETLHREVAIKVLNAELNDPEVARRFRAEAITVARLSHPGIATIYELFQHDGQWLMVMEFVRGETLERLIERAGPQAAERAAELCMHSLAALAHAHSMGVVHRDLKPANIMLTENGVIKIMDFGIARVAGTEHLTNAGFMMGTPAYMAPEQVLGHEIDARADLYAMGVVFYRLLTGQLPFKGETPFAMAQAQVNNPPTPIGTFRADLPPWVDEVMTKSLAKKPDDRYQSAVEFHELFSRSLTGQPAAAAYRSSAPTNLMMTPPKLATGQVPNVAPSTLRSGVSAQVPVVMSGSVPGAAEPGPTISAATPAALARPGTAALPAPGLDVASGGDDASGAQTVLSPSGAQHVLSPSGAQAVIAESGAQPSDLFGSGAVARPKEPSGAQAINSSGAVPAIAAGQSGPVVVPSPTSNTANDPAPSGYPNASVARVEEPKKSSTGLIGIAAGVLVVLGIGAYFMLRPAPAVPPVEPAPIEAAAVSPETPSTPEPAAGATAPAASAQNAGAPSVGVARGGATAPSALPPGGTVATTPGGAAAAALPPGTVPPGAARGTAAAPAAVAPVADDSILGVSNVRVLVVNGKKADDEEIVLNFGNGQIVIVNKKTGAPVATYPYRSIVGATYVRARDPKWNTAYASPPNDLDVGGMLRTSKHYLTLQSKDGYQILRLEDANVIRVLQAVEARTGITIERPKPGGDRN